MGGGAIYIIFYYSMVFKPFTFVVVVVLVKREKTDVGDLVRVEYSICRGRGLVGGVGLGMAVDMKLAV